MRFNRLYFPVLCITHLCDTVHYHRHYWRMAITYPAKSDPQEIEIPLGIKWAPALTRCQWRFDEGITNVPASLALVSSTVWNHVGKLYITVKLQLATRKLLIPTRTGIFCFNRKGANTGSGATNSSMITNATVKSPDNMIGTYTAGDVHCPYTLAKLGTLCLLWDLQGILHWTVYWGKRG